MINEVVLIGRMVKDPDLRYTKEGIPVASFRLAVNRSFKNHEGVTEADFVSCTAWRNLAKTTADYCRKGALVAVTGRIQTSRFEGKDGTTVFVTDIVVDNVRFLEKKREEKQAVPAASNATAPPPPPPNPDTGPYSQGQYGQTQMQVQPQSDNRQTEWNQIPLPQQDKNGTQIAQSAQDSQNFQESQVSSHSREFPNFMGRKPEKVEV